MLQLNDESIFVMFQGNRMKLLQGPIVKIRTSANPSHDSLVWKEPVDIRMRVVPGDDYEQAAIILLRCVA